MGKSIIERFRFVSQTAFSGNQTLPLSVAQQVQMIHLLIPLVSSSHTQMVGARRDSLSKRNVRILDMACGESVYVTST